ncbi:MAG: restriction endonuclease subunit S [Nitrospira sp.]
MKILNGWRRGHLGEQCSIEIGGTPSRNIPEYWDTSKETSNLWVSIRDLSQRITTQTAEHITDSGVKHSNVKRQPEGTVLLSFKLTIGRVAIAGLPLYTNEAIAGLRSEGITHEYLYHGLQQWDLLQGVDQAIKGATLNKAKLKRIEFDFPEAKPEQTKIAEILSTVDRAIEQTEALIAKQQRIKDGLMQDLLTRGIDEHGNLRSESTHKFKDSPLGRIPMEWEPARIGSAASLQRGHDITECNLQDGPYPVVSSSGIIGYHNQSTSKGPNVVVGRKGTIGKVHYLDSDFWAHDTSLYVTNFFGNNAMFIYYLFVHLDLARFGTKSGSPSLNRNDIHPLLFGLPPPDEQRAIAKILLLCEALTESLVRDLDKAKRLKTSLMQDLLTGTKRVTPLLGPAHI